MVVKMRFEFQLELSNVQDHCVINLKVIDNTSPIIECTNITINDFVMVDLSTTLKYSDNCQLQSVTQNVTANTTLELGMHAVNFMAVDSSGNIGQCTVFVYVVETAKDELATTFSTSNTGRAGRLNNNTILKFQE